MYTNINIDTFVKRPLIRVVRTSVRILKEHTVGIMYIMKIYMNKYIHTYMHI